MTSRRVASDFSDMEGHVRGVDGLGITFRRVAADVSDPEEHGRTIDDPDMMSVGGALSRSCPWHGPPWGRCRFGWSSQSLFRDYYPGLVLWSKRVLSEQMCQRNIVTMNIETKKNSQLI